MHVLRFVLDFLLTPPSSFSETDNPRKTVPSAIRKTFYRILFFFVFTVFFIGILVPYDNPDLLSGATNATASPLVIAAKLAGVPVLPSIINAVYVRLAHHELHTIR